MPDEKWGETVKAIVVLRPSHQATEAELIDHCRDRLAHYKCPTSIEFGDALARTATGKVQKFKLRAPYWEGRTGWSADRGEDAARHRRPRADDPAAFGALLACLS